MGGREGGVGRDVCGGAVGLEGEETVPVSELFGF